MKRVESPPPAGTEQTAFPYGAPAKSEILWGEENGMERAEASPEAGTEQSGISLDDDAGIPISWCMWRPSTSVEAPNRIS